MEEKVNYIVGIDFGHGEVTASCIDLLSDKKDVFALNINDATDKSEKRFPSLIYKYPSKNNPGQFEYSLDNTAGIVIEFKGRVDSNSEKIEAFRAFIKLIYDRILKKNADVFYKDGNLKNFKLYIAAPTKWNKQEKADYKSFFERALNRKIEWIINESDAAFFNHKANGNVLIIDFGSSTIDYTLMINNKKASIDELSNQLGASRIENEILLDYQMTDNYQEVYGKSIKRLKELEYGYIEPNEWLKYQFRKAKEEAYTKDEDDGDRSITFNVVYRTTHDLESKNKNFSFHHSFIIDDLITEYKNEVRNDLEKLKVAIKDKLCNEQLSKIILSGGASRMAWFIKMVEDVFEEMGVYYNEGKGNLFVDRNNCSYVVSEGIVKYAVTQLECLNEIEEEIEMLRPEETEPITIGEEEYDSIYHFAFSQARKTAIISCIKDNLKKVCNEYANAKEDLSVDIFTNKIKACFDEVISSKICQMQFKQELKVVLEEKLSEIVIDVLNKKFGSGQILNKSNSNFNLNLNIGDLSKFYGYLNAWFKNIYIDSKFHEIRKKEFDGKWKEWIWYLKSSKPRKKIMREHLAKELYNYVISGSADFSLSLSEEGEFKKCIGQLEEYAKQCAKEIFYNNELFDTRFKA